MIAAPTVRIKPGGLTNRIFNASGTVRWHRLRPFAIALAIIVFLELFVFNLPFWQTRHTQPVPTHEIEVGSGLVAQSDGTWVITDSKESWVAISSDQPIRYLYANPSEAESRILQYGNDMPGDERQPLSVVWTLSTKQATDGDWYPNGGGIQGYTPVTPDSRYSRVDNNAVQVKIMYIGDIGGKVPHTIFTANPHIPMRFSGLRLAVEMILAAIMLLFRPGSSLYRQRMQLRTLGTIVPLVALVSVECVIAVGLILVTASPDRANADLEYWSGIGSYWATDQYQRLADALAHGRVWLDYDVSPALAAMPNPYDAYGRFQLAFAHPDPHIYFDVAFYDGRYYSYFGVLPVLLLYLPYLLVTGTALPTHVALIVFDTLSVLASAVLAVQLARFVARQRGGVSLGVVLLGCVCMFLGDVVAIIMPYGLFYPIPQAAAICFAMLGLSCWIEAKLRGVDRCFGLAWIVLGSLCMAATVACRPQVILASLFALPLFWDDIVRLWRDGFHGGARDGLRGIHLDARGIAHELGVWLCAAVPYVVVIAGQFAYNASRFGSPTDFGANYNLTGYDMTHNGMTVSRYITFFFLYFLQPPNLSSRFPFVEPVLWPTVTFRSYHFNVGSYFMAVSPFALIAFGAFIWYRQLRAARLHGMTLCAAVVTLSVFLIDSRALGVDFRYMMDFGWVVVTAALLVTYVIDTYVNIDWREGVILVGELPDTSLGGDDLRSIARSGTFSFLIAGVMVSTVMLFLKQFMADNTNLVPSMNMAVGRWWDVASWFVFLQ